MDDDHRAIRARLSRMSPRKATEWVRSIGLPEVEAACIIECDIRRRSCVQAAEALHMSVDGLRKARRRAYGKLADEMKE